MRTFGLDGLAHDGSGTLRPNETYILDVGKFMVCRADSEADGIYYGESVNDGTKFPTVTDAEAWYNQATKIVVGSKSKHKRRGFEAACKEAGIDYAILCVDRDTTVPEQPYGVAETLAGATARATGNAENAEKQEPGGDLFAGGESGLMEAGPDFVLDLAIWVIRGGGRILSIATSPGMMFPKSAVEEARRLGFNTTTAGRVLAHRLGGDHTNPHSTLSHGLTPRELLLKQGAIVALSTMHIADHDSIAWPLYKALS
jgi:non-canonical (house-cleaning) NTP pyrophosphatase